MMRFTYKRGLSFIEGQMRWTLERLLASKKYQLVSDSGEIQNLFADEIHSKWLQGQWVVDEACLGSLANAMYLVTPRDLSTYTANQQKVALRKQGYLKAVDPEKNRYNVAVWEVLIGDHAAAVGDLKPPCASSVQGWWRKYRLTKSMNALIPRKKGRSPAYREDRYAIFEEAVSEVYLTLEKQPKSAVFDRVHRRIENVNASRDLEGRICCPARSTVYRWLDELRQDIVDGARLGAEAARTKYRTSMGGLKVSNVLERIEIDHTPLDLIVIDVVTKLSRGRPWLTMAQDKNSRMPMGFYISFNTPSSNSVLQCLRRSILPKTEWLALYPDIKGTWPAQGIPDLVAVDNGMDLHSEGLQKACEEMGIQILFCGARIPEHKGSIERFFRTMNEDLIHRLPGTTFSNVEGRGDYPAEDRAAITLENLVYLVTKWIVDIHIVKRHRALGDTPLAKWSESASRRTIELPVYPQLLDVISGIPAQRTLFHYGIELEGMHYNSRQLQQLRRISGKNMPVDLKFYEDSISFIHVFDSESKEYLQVPAVDPKYAENLSRDIHRLIREKARKQYGPNPSTMEMLEARAQIETAVYSAIKDKKMATRKRAGGLLMHDSESILNSKDPLANALRPVREAIRSAPEDLPDGLDDALPVLRVFDKGSEV